MKAYLQVLWGLKRDARLYLVTSLFVGVSYYGFFIVLFNLYLLRLGYDTRFIGTISASGTLCFVLLSLPASALGKRWGSRRPVLVGLALYTLGFCLLPFAEFVPPTLQTPWLVGSYVLGFLGSPLYWVNGNLFLTENTKPSERHHAFAVRTALLPLAGFLGSLVAGVLPGLFATLFDSSLTQPAPYRYALWISGLLYLPAFLIMLATHEGIRSNKLASSSQGRPPYALIVPLALVEMFRMAGEVGALGFFNVYLDDALEVTTSGVGVLSGLALLGSGLAALVTPLLADRWGNKRTIVLAMLGMAGGLVVMTLAHWLSAGIGYLVVMALASVSISALSVYRMHLVHAAWWSAMSGAVVTGQGIGESVVLLAGGFIISSSGYSLYFLLVAGLVLTGALLLTSYFRANQEDESTPAS
jgi:MFS family permease